VFFKLGAARVLKTPLLYALYSGLYGVALRRLILIVLKGKRSLASSDKRIYPLTITKNKQIDDKIDNMLSSVTTIFTLNYSTLILLQI